MPRGHAKTTGAIHHLARRIGACHLREVGRQGGDGSLAFDERNDLWRGAVRIRDDEFAGLSSARPVGQPAAVPREGRTKALADLEIPGPVGVHEMDVVVRRDAKSKSETE
jgi:hypothetical protein